MISPSQTQGGYHHLRLLDYRSNACARDVVGAGAALGERLILLRVDNRLPSDA